MSIHPVCAKADIQLPNEIISIIINELVSDSGRPSRITREALASCRLVSHVLYSIASPILFSSLDLTKFIYPGTTREGELIQLLSNHDVAASVHTLILRRGKTILEYSQGTLFCEIVNCLPHIQNFTLDYSRESYPLPAFSMPQKAIQALCTSPNLTTLDFTHIASFPITFITACPNLRRLRLNLVGFYFDDVNPMDEPSSRQPVFLDSLKTDQASIVSLGTGFFSNKSFAKYFSGIRNLQITNMFDCTTSVRPRFAWYMILLASQTLTTLDLIGYGTTYGRFYPANFDLSLEDKDFSFDLARLPALRHFKVQLPNCSNDLLPRLPLLSQLLSISSSSGVEILELIITWYRVEIEQMVSLFTCAEWATLDEILSSEKFASLQKVVLDLRLDMDYHFDPEDRKKGHFHATNLFPTFRRHRTLETHLKWQAPRTSTLHMARGASS